MGNTIFFVKGSLLIKVLVIVLEAVETGRKSPLFNKNFTEVATLAASGGLKKYIYYA